MSTERVKERSVVKVRREDRERERRGNDSSQSRGGWERRKNQMEEGRETLTVLILNKEVKLIRFISNGCL